MHDLGKVVDKSDMIILCEQSGHIFLDNEKDVPSILHQIASKILAEKVFKITDKEDDHDKKNINGVPFFEIGKDFISGAQSSTNLESVIKSNLS